MVPLSRKPRVAASFALFECFLLLTFSWLMEAATPSSPTENPPSQRPPHILFVLIDDLGWGNVGFHRMDDDDPTKHPKQTPNMNQLVQEGVELNRHYVHHSCTGTRTSLQSGRFPVHVQTSLKNPEDPSSGMPRNLTGFAEYLQRQKYATHYVGKWDVGMATPKHTPKGRGYDTSLNYFEHKVRSGKIGSTFHVASQPSNLILQQLIFLFGSTERLLDTILYAK
jgi:arylsulfatase A-like enzyme